MTVASVMATAEPPVSCGRWSQATARLAPCLPTSQDQRDRWVRGQEQRHQRIRGGRRDPALHPHWWRQQARDPAQLGPGSRVRGDHSLRPAV